MLQNNAGRRFSLPQPYVETRLPPVVGKLVEAKIPRQIAQQRHSVVRPQPVAPGRRECKIGQLNAKCIRFLMCRCQHPQLAVANITVIPSPGGQAM
jgi:hypothetical protein